MSDIFQIRIYQEEDHEQLVNLWKTCGLVVHWNDPSKDIQRKVSRVPDGLLLGWLEQKLVASVMAGYEVIEDGSIISPWTRNSSSRVWPGK